MAAADSGNSPGRAPPIAMEHGKRPQVDGVGAVLGVKQLTKAVQIRAPMRIHDALGLSCGSRRVVDRDRRELVLDRPLHREVRSTLEQVWVPRAARNLGNVVLD